MKNQPLNLTKTNVRLPQSQGKPLGLQTLQMVGDEKDIERIINEKKRTCSTADLFLRLKPFQQVILGRAEIEDIIKKGTCSSDETFVPLKVFQQVMSEPEIDKIIDEKKWTHSIDEMFVPMKDFQQIIIAGPEIDKIANEKKGTSSPDETFVPLKDLRLEDLMLAEQTTATPEEIEQIKREKEASTQTEPAPTTEPEHEPEEPKPND